MKIFRIIPILAAAFMLSLSFTSCDEKDNLDTEKADKNTQTSAYLPIEYANKQVAAWYMLTDQSDNKTKIEAVFLFKDSTLAVTKVKFYSESDGRKPEYDINATGRYKITQGDYTNGKADVITSGGDAFEVNIENGILYAMNEEFTKMSNSLLPSAYNPNGGGNNQGGGDDVTGNSIYGTWIDDLANPYSSLILNTNGTGSMQDENFNFTYKNDTLVYDQESKYVITIDGDIMTWAYIDEEYGMMDPQVWYRSNATFDKQVSTGRWNGLMGEDGSDCGIVFFFYENEVEFYIIAWGEQLKGSFTHEGGIINFNLREGYKARIGDAESWSWEAGNLDPETLRLTEGYEWWQMDNEVLSERKQELEKITFALVSDVKAYGSLFSRAMTIVKAK